VSGVQVQPADTFRVTMNNFLAFGGDGFTVFNQGSNALGGAQDIDALVAYFAENEPTGIAVPPLNRIVPFGT
jgi:5'-nucleotidase